jgi:hypothetical protein
MSDNISQGYNKVQGALSSGMQVIESGMQSSNYLDKAATYGYQGIPYIAFGMVAVFLGVVGYATVADSDFTIASVLPKNLPFTQNSPAEEIEKEKSRIKEEDAETEKEKEESLKKEEEEKEKEQKEEQKEEEKEQKEQKEEEKEQKEEEKEQKEEEEENKPKRKGGRSKKSKRKKNKNSKKRRSRKKRKN